MMSALRKISLRKISHNTAWAFPSVSIRAHQAFNDAFQDCPNNRQMATSTTFSAIKRLMKAGYVIRVFTARTAWLRNGRCNKCHCIPARGSRNWLR
jgi:hypothetical protein